MLADFVDGLNYVHGDASMSPWEASEILAGWGLSNKYEELGAGTISPFSMLLSTEDIEEVLRLASINSGTGTGDLESAKDAPITHTNFVGVHPETAMHRDAYWFDQCPGATYEGYVLESVSADTERNSRPHLQLPALDMDLCTDTKSVEDVSLDYCLTRIAFGSDSTATDEPEAFLGEQGTDSDLLSDCEPNVTRGPSDMYTPHWMRGMGKSKEGLCPICYNNGVLNWKLMKCSAYWYHLNYYHGVSSLTGRPFPEPQATRVVIAGSGKQRRQGQCHICLEWVNTESTRKARVNVPEIYWWKHIQACIKRTWDE